MHPGVIAVNTATFVGHKYRGVSGGVVATLGLVFPSLIIITLIAAFLSSFADSPLVQHALGGINACVVALIAVSVLKLGKSTLKNAPPCAFFWRFWPWRRWAACCLWTPPPPSARRWASSPPPPSWWCWPE